MRDMIRQVVSAYQSIKLEGQGPGYVLFSGQEPGTKLPVTIKVLSRVLGQDPKIAARFRALSQTMRQLNHPNIATVREVGEKAGLPFIVTRVIERAQPLADRLDQPWAIDAAADLVMQTGQALEHAYSKGLVHGSLSPQEIMLRSDGRVAITDFGLTQLLDLIGVQVKQAASPYVAPERTAGQAADPRSDVYSLAAVLYTLLAHRQPMIVQGQALAPGRFNSDVPPAMDEVVVKALAPNPADRYPDVKAFLAALGAVALVPAVAKAMGAATGQRCPKCGTENQTGRFCRNCGAGLDKSQAKPTTTWPRSPAAVAKPTAAAAAPAKPLSALGRKPSTPKPPSKAGEPIQVTKIEVGSMQIGRGVEAKQFEIARPMAVASGEMAAMFPEPLAMPQVDTGSLAPALDRTMITMPEPPPMPVIDWATIAPPMPEVPTIEDVAVKQEGT
jgi:eukaryotic-like serine/threonine-protein kinase